MVILNILNFNLIADFLNKLIVIYASINLAIICTFKISALSSGRGRQVITSHIENQ